MCSSTFPMARLQQGLTTKDVVTRPLTHLHMCRYKWLCVDMVVQMSIWYHYATTVVSNVKKGKLFQNISSDKNCCEYFLKTCSTMINLHKNDSRLKKLITKRCFIQN